jgi:type II secretory pathway pseudopilin PulG
VTGSRRRARQAGFTYLALLLAVAIMGVWLGATASVYHLSVQREKEQELLFIGNQFRQALERYSASTSGGARRLPLRLEDLLLDERLVAKRRHLRRIYVDPMTGKDEWGLVLGAGGQIVGVHSLSTDEPIKKAGFDARDQNFSDKTRYAEWVFLAKVGATQTPVGPKVAPIRGPVPRP